MKILMMAPEPFFEPRGTPISVYQRLEALSAMGYKVDLLTYHVGQDVNIPGVTIHRCLHVPFIKKVRLGPSWPKAFLDILVILHAIFLLSRNRYGVIHSHEEAAFWSVPLSRFFRTSHVYDMHSCLPKQLASVPQWDFWPFLRLFEAFEKWVVDTCDVVITIGSDLEEHVKGLNPGVKTVLIQNLPVSIRDAGTNHSTAQQLRDKSGLNGRVPVVYTGTFERYQGLDLLLRSASIVKEHCPEVSFVLVGGDPQQVGHWQSRAEKLGLEDAMLFTGAVPLAEAITYLDVAEILVSPRTEGTSVPLKIYSYLHSGKPIVATDVVAHSQTLSGETAILVEPTADAFAEGIVTLAESADLRRELGLRGQQFAREKFDPAEYLVKLEQVYKVLEPPDQGRVQKGAADAPQTDRARSPKERWLTLL